MNLAIKRLQTLRVADIMSKEVVQISVHQKMDEAAEIFAKNDISAAPVVDEQGVCVGILSATDFLKRDLPGFERERPTLGMEQHEIEIPTDEEPLHIVPCIEELVSAYMSSAVQSVSPDAPLLTAANMMSTQHFHRLLVLDEKGRTLGVVSTMDIIASLLNALDELKSTTAEQLRSLRSASDT